MSNTRQMQKEETRRALLTAAYDVFSQKGILNTRISDVAAAAGVSHGAVFVHFSSLDMLITETVGFYGRKIAMRTHELAESCAHLADILHAHLAGIKEFEPFYTRLIIENRLLPAAARDVWVSLQSAVAFHFIQATQREAYADIPPHLLFNTWMGLVNHYITNGDLFAPSGSVIGRYEETLVSGFLKLAHIQPGQ